MIKKLKEVFSMDWLCDVELDLDVIIENLDLDSYIHVEEENYY